MESESTDNFNTAAFLNEFSQMMAERFENAHSFLNGRDSHDLSDEEFDQLQEISGNNFLDKRNPEHVQMMTNDLIFDAREAYLEKVNDRSKVGALDWDLGLNIRNINKGVLRSELW